ncbi:MAG: radical SAM protein [Desulfobulbaceae bacterium]|nr:radical SAM protein [Desulfobulbaceae bacterium]
MPLVIPVFIPHQGCPHCCVFCNQFRITGSANNGEISAPGIGDAIRSWMQRSRPTAGEVQVAFYGGSFTGMDYGRQEDFLDAVGPFVEQGKVKTIRLSTRPDYVDRHTLSFLHRKKVGIVELGVQSLDDTVLAACGRGHTAEQSVRAVQLLQQSGFTVGVQLMLGLPLQTTGSLMRTVRQVASLQPDFVRIYPVLVLRGSMLAELYEKGRYRPLTLGAAVVQTARMKEYLDQAGIRTVRMGLQACPELEENLLAGPYHPAFGEMVCARLMLKKTRKILRDVRAGKRVVLIINDRDQSIFRGIRSANMKRLAELNLAGRFVLRTDSKLPRFTVRLDSGDIPDNKKKLN